MALSIEDPEADRLARKVAEITGETITEAVIVSLRARLAREEAKPSNIDHILEDVRAISRHFMSLPLLDDRSDDEMPGYDERGLLR